jgi:type IV pilus assembly protein PilW
MVMAMGLAMMVLAGVVILLSTSNRAYVAQDQVVSMEQNIRASMEVMGHELRMAGYIPLNNLAGGASIITTDVSGQSWSDGILEPIEEAAANSITFVADLNLDDNAETVSYRLSGGNIERRSWTWRSGAWVAQGDGGWTPLAENVTGVGFVYQFADGGSGLPDNTDSNVDNDTDDIRSLEVVVTGQTAAVLETTSGTGHVQGGLQSHLVMRNMGLETQN